MEMNDRMVGKIRITAIERYAIQNNGLAKSDMLNLYLRTIDAVLSINTSVISSNKGTLGMYKYPGIIG